MQGPNPLVGDSAEVRLMRKACVSHDWDTVTSLIRQHGQIVCNIRVLCGLTPLHYAALRNKPEVMDVLLKNGAYPNAVTNENISPLSHSASTGSEECVKMLLEAQADVGIISKEGKTAMHYMADNEGSLSLAKMLVLRGGSALPHEQDVDPIEYNENTRANGSDDEVVKYLKKMRTLQSCGQAFVVDPQSRPGQ